MRDALVFNGARNLDFQDIRANVIRIPEVIQRLRQAQQIWDTVATKPLDLLNFVGSDDTVFLNNIKLKSFATAVVQVGLLDRYLRNYRLPDFVVGAINGDSPMRVAIGQMDFVDLVTESPASSAGQADVAATGGETQLSVGAIDLPVLAGVQITEYAIYQRDLSTNTYERVHTDAREANRMILELVSIHEVNRLVMIGPGSSISGRKLIDLTSRDIQVVESIDLDPMLSWFWSHLKENRLAIAN